MIVSSGTPARHVGAPRSQSFQESLRRNAHFIEPEQNFRAAFAGDVLPVFVFEGTDQGVEHVDASGDLHSMQRCVNLEWIARAERFGRFDSDCTEHVPAHFANALHIVAFIHDLIAINKLLIFNF